MKGNALAVLSAGCAAAILTISLTIIPVRAGSEAPPFMPVGGLARAPAGWTAFCAEYAPECDTPALDPRDIMLTIETWNELVRINDWVNEAIEPMTDLEHWGVPERWNYPDDRYGDCEDYVLLKRRMLLEAGWRARRC